MYEFFLKKLRIINYLLAALILLTALLFTRNIISIGFSKKASPLTKTKQGMETIPLAKMKDINDYAPILEKNPFGPPMKLIPISTEQKGEKIASPSELILIGTTVGPANLSYAILEDKSHSAFQGQEVFAHGHKVYDYGTITKIEKDWVELTQGTIASRISIAEPQTKEITTGASQPSFGKKISESQYVLDKEVVQNALKNPQQIMTDARLLPNVVKGKIEGFKISEVKQNGMYGNLGIRNGDILLKINNLEMSNPESALQAMSALGGMNSVNLDIIRDGAKMTMSYDIR